MKKAENFGSLLFCSNVDDPITEKCKNTQKSITEDRARDVL